MARKLKYDIPGPDWRVAPAEVRERGFEAIFASDVAKPLPLVLEIGFGRGEFLLDLAERHPETAHVGVEYSYTRTFTRARRRARTPLRNVRLMEATGEQVVDELLPDASISTLWINFPDPWPKKRHHRRRLIQPAFVARAARRLVPGGMLRFATDHEGYAEWTDAVLRAEHAPESFRPTEADRLPTAYELEWRALGRAFHFFAYARRGPSV
jgi:tRNA (guanine-N7-)-methyltransferase